MTENTYRAVRQLERIFLQNTSPPNSKRELIATITYNFETGEEKNRKLP